MLAAVYRTLFRCILRFGVPIAVTAAGIAVIAGVLTASLPIDMSFRPLFSNDAEALAATELFEAEFGQESGAHIGVVLQAEDVFDDEFLRQLYELSEATSRLEHVTEVVSLTHLHVPEWTGLALQARRWPRDGMDYAHAASSLRIFAEAQPQAVNKLLSDDFTKTVLWARLDVPLADLAARREVLECFQALVASHVPSSTERHVVGVSVVEAAYADIVMHSLAKSVGLTMLLVIVTLMIVFGSWRAALIALSGVSLATPITLGIMQRTGQALTMTNSMVVTLVLVVGVADAVHMLLAYREQLSAGSRRLRANHRMFSNMTVPCLMTTATTTVGFLSLQLASLAAIRDFGMNVAIGVALVYVLNLSVVPLLIHWLRPWDGAGETTRSRPSGSRFLDKSLARPVNGLVDLVARRPATVSLVVAVGFGVTGAAIPRLDVQQRFNEELAPAHPVRAAQALLESHFGGILGPEVCIERIDGASLLGAEERDRILEFSYELRARDDVLSVFSFLDLLPSGTPSDVEASAVNTLRQGPLAATLRSVLNADATRAGVIVRTVDMGSREAGRFVRDVEALAAEHLGSEFRARVVGRWWLAQTGMSHLLRDMLVSFGTACLVVIPILALVVRRFALFVVGVVGNVLPMLFALGLMAALGISLRIGTSMILAIALGIAIDDTIHLLARLNREGTHNRGARHSVRSSLQTTGRALICTSVILIVGFGSMSTSSLLAIRDMGIVGACTFASALLVDLTLVPALYLVLAERRWPRLRAAPQAASRRSRAL